MNCNHLQDEQQQQSQKVQLQPIFKLDESVTNACFPNMIAALFSVTLQKSDEVL